MFCLIALIIFSVLGIFSATHRQLAKEALDCVFRRATLRPCNTGFDKKVKGKVIGKLLNRFPKLAKGINRFWEQISWFLVIVFFASLFFSVRSVYNYYIYGSCNGLNESGFCAFDYNGENNKVTDISQTCGVEEENEENITLKGVDFSTFPSKDIGSEDTVILIGCYECDYTRKAYNDIQKLVRKKSTNYIFAHYPAKQDTRYLSEIGYCVYREYGEKFWAFNDFMFTVEKTKISHPEYINTILEKFNFDANRINECAKDPETEKIVDKQINELQKTNLYGTPTVFINDQVLVGPKPYRVYKSMLNKFKIF